MGSGIAFQQNHPLPFQELPEDRRSAPPDIPLRAVTGAASLRGHVTCAVKMLRGVTML